VLAAVPAPFGYNGTVERQPTLVVVSGPAGAGKTTLAHKIAEAVGCPAVCRDEIKEGMLHPAAAGFVPGPGDELTRRAWPVFFDVLGVLLRAGVTTVAEAAFQNRTWRSGLEPLRDLAHLRVVHCAVAPDVAFERILSRRHADQRRGAHPDPAPSDVVAHAAGHRAFERLSVDALWIEVDTTDGYRPELGQVVAFVNRQNA
jgi:predicted kinase